MRIIKTRLDSGEESERISQRKRWKSAFDPVIPENYSGWWIPERNRLFQLRKKDFVVLRDTNAGGEAPKDLIRVYEKEKVYTEKGKAKFHRRNQKKWTLYLAKAPYKWYPVESITEHLLNRLGESIGIKMAGSRIVRVGERIFFLSRYFLKSDEQLVHGAQMYAGYLSDDVFVQQVEAQKLEHEIFTFQEAEKAIKHAFPKEASHIFESLVKLLIFDAFVGNSDRHFYNWGVHVDIKGKKVPCFSPVYDTARGLFWNTSEPEIQKVAKTKGRPKMFVEKYAQGSKPKMGWDGKKGINHFEFFRLISKEDCRFGHICVQIINEQNLEVCFSVIDDEFAPLLSTHRIDLIKQCLQVRFDILKALL
ncbi:MAG: HipA domain-containing protein [Bacteroidota bacterium]